jgi:hypothetical protein
VADAIQDSEPPKAMPNVVPLDIAGAGQTRLIVEAVKESVAELKSDVKDIRSHRVSDLVWHVSTLAAGFVLLAGMMIAAYFKIDDKISDISKASTRIETKLDDLVQRIPPVQAPAPLKH